MRKLRILVGLLVLVALMTVFSACTVTAGGILMNEQPFGAQFDISFQDWSAQDKCEMKLEKGEAILVEIVRESGDLAMTIRGDNGSEPYTGQYLETGSFLLNVSESDNYVIHLEGEHACGEIVLKRVSD